MKKIEIILLHIKEDCCDIQKFIKDATKEQFLESALIKKAVCMSLINIGELVKSLPKNFCDANPQLPWRRIAGMRDIAAHKYKQLDMDAVWIVANERIQEILDFIEDYQKN
jgi:uncharacterized protein with HEPN domain